MYGGPKIGCATTCNETKPAGVNSDCPGSQSRNATLLWCIRSLLRRVLAKVDFPFRLGPLIKNVGFEWSRGTGILASDDLHERGISKGLRFCVCFSILFKFLDQKRI